MFLTLPFNTLSFLPLPVAAIVGGGGSGLKWFLSSDQSAEWTTPNSRLANDSKVRQRQNNGCRTLRKIICLEGKLNHSVFGL